MILNLLLESNFQIQHFLEEMLDCYSKEKEVKLELHIFDMN